MSEDAENDEDADDDEDNKTPGLPTNDPYDATAAPPYDAVQDHGLPAAFYDPARLALGPRSHLRAGLQF
ncbi:MAG: hypothetical protein M1832_006398 [Thelocarpon impressellum]|nr:MAG: hypothetical protein M1832_006398 [Thelocarpon impressellum]